MEITTIINENTNNKCKFCCNKIPNKEWSGVIFYTIDGKKIKVLDMILQSIGNMAQVETNQESEEFIRNYRIKHFSTQKNIYMGRIHSHNSMGVFFSNTDKTHLSQMVGENQPILSIVTNNDNKYYGQFVYYQKNYFGISEIYYSELNIVIENVINVDKEFNKIVTDIITKDKQKEIKQLSIYNDNDKMGIPEWQAYVNDEYNEYKNPKLIEKEFSNKNDFQLLTYFCRKYDLDFSDITPEIKEFAKKELKKTPQYHALELEIDSCIAYNKVEEEILNELFIVFNEDSKFETNEDELKEVLKKKGYPLTWLTFLKNIL